jgi:H+/Cl- antiporter ClcA
LPHQMIPQALDFLIHFMTVIIIGAIVFLLVWLVTIIDIVRSDFKKDVDKVVWFLFVLIFPPLGVFLYLFIGRFRKTETSSISRYTRYRDIGRD